MEGLYAPLFLILSLLSLPTMSELSLVEKVSQVQGAIRQTPSDDKLRIHLFQLYVQQNWWQKALAQLQVAAQLNASHKMMAQAYRLAIRAEMVREEVFKGKKSPHVLGQPLQWISYLIEALQADGQGHSQQALELRLQALDQASAVAGRLDDQPFGWIADTDSRLGPVLEVFVNGGYYWLPFEAIRDITMDAPVDLRDLVWLPAQITLVNEGHHAMLLPTRYPLVDGQAEDGHLQSRASTWTPMEGDLLRGQGVKVLTTDTRDASLLDTRAIHLDSAAPED